MRVLHVAETIKGGVASYLNDLSREQTSNSDIRLAFIIPRQQKKYLDVNSELYTFESSGRNLRSMVSFSIAVVLAIYRFKPDIIHLHSSVAGAVVRLLPMKIGNKIHYCPHGVAIDASREKWKRYIVSKIEKLLSVRSASIICISKYEYDQLESIGIAKSKLKLVPNAIDLRGIKYKCRTARVAKRFIFVGRLDRQKGVDLLLDCFSNLSGKDVFLDIVGDQVVNGDCLPVCDNPNVSFSGWLSRGEVFDKFIEADFLIMPSRWEGFGLVAAEAIASGLPVIASSAGALPDVVFDGVDGMIFQSENKESLLHSIYRAIESGPGKFAQTIRSKDCANYTMKNVSDCILEVYRGSSH